MFKKEKYDYFDEFISLTEYIYRSSNILKDIVVNYDINKLEENISEVHKIENLADRKVHSIRNNLVKDFLPPIDREDIVVISKRLDNIEDGIDEVLINFKILNIKNIKEDVIELIDILIMCCDAVKDMFMNLNHFRDVDLINKKVIQINKMEEHGDKVYEKIMSSLYKNDKDPMSVIRWTEIYNCLEATIDECEAVSDCIADIILKNS